MDYLTEIETDGIYGIDADLLRGDALHPSDCDLIVLSGLLDVGKPVPKDWRVIDGNSRFSRVAIVVLRYEAPEV